VHHRLKEGLIKYKVALYAKEREVEKCGLVEEAQNEAEELKKY